MVVLPDGAMIEMSWKQVKYINHDSFIILQIIPMIKAKDIILIPNKERWRNIENVFSLNEREEIIFLLEHINWKRDINIIELDIYPILNKEFDINTGMIESTKGYDILNKENLFDVDSKLEKEQVKNVYCKLEEKFAKISNGTVVISRDLLIKGSVLYEITMPAFEKNSNVILEIK
jgi:hypothetical protein